ncbi:hypothetical protein, partial [Klebsiella pneumoniae]|uniref:hypothetical protein n=1 Tax=Klebsiella pneumoniae TaxID=573 RepID=UPI00226E1875
MGIACRDCRGQSGIGACECLRCSRLDDDGCVIRRLRRCLRRLSIGDDDIGGSDGGGSVRSRRR